MQMKTPMESSVNSLLVETERELVEEELQLTDLIDVKTLQRIQDAFSDMTGIASLTTDVNGIAVTEGSHFSDFCMRYTRKSALGCERCEKCDRFGAELALSEGKSLTYTCHAGLVDFAAPIMAKDHMVGCFIGGQVLTEEPQKEAVYEVAKELGIDEEEYWQAICKVKVIDKDAIDKAAEFLYNVAEVFSDMAYNRYLAYHANLEIAKATKLKSDFLANMSHEIRTPMNAVIGMAELALREELPDAAREYINEIKASSKSLLTIINDILDFSKIESGKMDITEEEYEPMSVFYDISTMLMTNVQEKNIDLILNVMPDLPTKLFGDSTRVKQIVLNIANNAVKFTKQGKVQIDVSCEPKDEKDVNLKIQIQDTGIGIRGSDKEKLFQSFQQVDSKRNRDIEGTGLGLAISKHLVELMEGSIDFESEYEKGSTFYIEIPQKVIERNAIDLSKKEEKLIVSTLRNSYIEEQLQLDAKHLGVPFQKLASEEDLPLLQRSNKDIFLFVENGYITKRLENFIRSNYQITTVVVAEFGVDESRFPSGVVVIRKPLYVLNLAQILQFEKVQSQPVVKSENDFIAPDARVLVVDDNPVNLKVTEGLLGPLKMRVDVALSGKEAIRKISVEKYDLIFMDHMMPELDGIETTRIIRDLYTHYENVPIIAVTANAIEGTKEMFLAEGFNDYVPKPIEMRFLISKVKQWLPKSRIKSLRTVSDLKQVKNTQRKQLEISDLDTKSALEMLGSEELYLSILEDYCSIIPQKIQFVKSLIKDEKWEEYTIEVHAIKSSSRQIGATSLGEMAALLEQAGKRKDIEYIISHTDEMLIKYESYKDINQSCGMNNGNV